MMLTYDAWAVDTKHIYNYNEARGLTKAVQVRDGAWDEVVATNKDVIGLKGVSMVCVKDKIFLRHKGCDDKPFVVYSCETL